MIRKLRRTVTRYFIEQPFDERGNRIILKLRIHHQAVIYIMLLTIMLAGLSATAHAKENLVAPAYGYYKIVATNGHGNGQEL